MRKQKMRKERNEKRKERKKERKRERKEVKNEGEKNQICPLDPANFHSNERILFVLFW